MQHLDEFHRHIFPTFIIEYDDIFLMYIMRLVCKFYSNKITKELLFNARYKYYSKFFKTKHFNGKSKECYDNELYDHVKSNIKNYKDIEMFSLINNDLKLTTYSQYYHWENSPINNSFILNLDYTKDTFYFKFDKHIHKKKLNNYEGTYINPNIFTCIQDFFFEIEPKNFDIFLYKGNLYQPPTDMNIYSTKLFNIIKISNKEYYHCRISMSPINLNLIREPLYIVTDQEFIILSKDHYDYNKNVLLINNKILYLDDFYNKNSYGID